MPRFNWVLLFNKLPGKKALVIGSHQDAQEVFPIAEHVYLLENGTDSDYYQADKVVNGKITVVNDNEIANLNIDIAIVYCTKNLSNKLRNMLDSTFPHDKCHVVYHYKCSTLFNRIIKVIEINRVSGYLLYFPYKSFDFNHFIDIFRNGLCLKKIIQLLKHTLVRTEFGAYIPKSGCRSNIENIISYVSNMHGLNISVPSRIRNGSTGSYLADLGDYILRVPHSDFANDRYCKNNFSVLQKLSGMDLPFRVPDAVGEGEYGGNHYYIESKILGTSLDIIKQDTPVVDAVFRHALIALNDSRMLAGIVTEQSAHNLIHQEMLGLASHLTSEQIKLYEEFNAAFVIMAVGMKIPLVITHGDYKSSNFIITQDRFPTISGVIDWEFSPLAWFPLYDFLVLVVNHFYRLKGQHELIRYVFEIEQGQGLGNVNELMTQYTESLCLDKSLILPIMIICLFRHMNVNYVETQKEMRFWSEIFSDTIDPMVNKFLRTT